MSDVNELHTIAGEAVHASRLLRHRVSDFHVATHLSRLATLKATPTSIDVEVALELRAIALDARLRCE
jgi:hypothetical protein